MVARKFLVSHNDSEFDLDYDTEDGFEVLKFQIFSLTSVLPDEQKIIGGENVIITDESDLNSVSDHLRLISITDDHDNQESLIRIEREDQDESVVESSSSSSSSSSSVIPVEIIENDTSFGQSDEELARMLQAEEEALFFQQFRAPNDNRGEFEQRIRPYVTQALMYEDPVRQEAARSTVPMDELEEKTLVSLAKEGNFKPSKVEKDHAFLLQLLFWFKRSFRWVNSPPCDGCSSETVNIGMGVGLPSEIQFGGSRVELYRCKSCLRVTRFPRYNDPLKLVETRRGRCGEWANCFTLYCRAFGYDSRLILDFSDHVWTECFSHYLGRWMHLDPCEGIYDNPLLYEKGWNKKLSYVIAFAKGGVHDVTKRYTRKWHEVLTRRDICTESVVSSVLSDITKECRKCFTSQELALFEKRDRDEAEKLERDLHSQNDASISLPGRQSGAKEWRIARSELDARENNSFSQSSCPVRLCVDDHVGRIYNGFYPLLSHFVDKGLSNSDIVEILEELKKILMDLSKGSFRLRKASINLHSSGPKFVSHEMIPSIDELLAALSLEAVRDTDGMLNIGLAGDPVKTAIALPVALDAVDKLSSHLRNSDNSYKDFLSLPCLKLNRISSGLVVASGEELPFGIVTSAFDGTCMSKWEEPKGSEGCWLLYKVRDGKKHVLDAYEMMSANDAPERDPMNWVVEGSEDEGTSWHVLDKRTSQVFEKRFQHKTYKIESAKNPSNVFRFRFLSVRDPQATSRLQIGSIDLYAKHS